MTGILIDEMTGDLQINVRRGSDGKITGGLVIGDNRYDVARRILEAYPGEFKEVPKLGCFAVEQLNGTPNPFWRSKAIKQLRENNIKAESLTISENGINIEIQ